MWSLPEQRMVQPKRRTDLGYTAALDKIHAVMPQDAWSYYDDFMCKFSRDEDGMLRYMGKPVR